MSKVRPSDLLRLSLWTRESRDQEGSGMSDSDRLYEHVMDLLRMEEGNECPPCKDGKHENHQRDFWNVESGVRLCRCKVCEERLNQK